MFLRVSICWKVTTWYNTVQGTEIFQGIEGFSVPCRVQVRFGLEAFPEDANVAQQWASETLVAKNGLVFCTEDMGSPVPGNPHL